MRLFLSLLLFLSACSSNDWTGEETSGGQSAAQGDSVTLTVSFGPQTRVGASESGTGWQLQWLDGDEVNLCFVQDGKPVYVKAPVTIDSDAPQRGTVKVKVKDISFSQSYDVYGFTGAGEWDDTSTSGQPAIVVSPSTELYSSLNDALSRQLIIFSATDQTSAKANVSGSFVGNIYKLSMYNYYCDPEKGDTGTPRTYTSMGLKAQDDTKTPFYDTSLRTTVDPSTGSVTGQASRQLLFNTSLSLSLGAKQTGYAYAITTTDAPGTKVSPIVITSSTDKDTTLISANTVSLPAASTKMRSMGMVQTQSGLYVHNSAKPTKLSSISEVDKWRADWMQLYPDKFPVMKMLLPGTHDTETVEFNGISAILTSKGQCQDHHIADQLAAGVRAIDIRLGYDGSNLWVRHGDLWTKIEAAANVFTPVINFLKSHPKEMVVMSIKDEKVGSSEIVKWVELLLPILKRTDFAPYIADRLTPETTLGEVRGKIVLLTRYGLWDYQKGNNMNGWGDNKSQACSMTTYGTPHVTTQLWVQDVYSGINTSQKASYAQQTFLRSVDMYYKKGWTINFTSLAAGFITNPGTNAKAINPAMIAWLKQQKLPFSGIVYTDFITRETDVQGPELMRQLL